MCVCVCVCLCVWSIFPSPVGGKIFNLESDFFDWTTRGRILTRYQKHILMKSRPGDGYNTISKRTRRIKRIAIKTLCLQMNVVIIIYCCCFCWICPSYLTYDNSMQSFHCKRSLPLFSFGTFCCELFKLDICGTRPMFFLETVGYN